MIRWVAGWAALALAGAAQAAPPRLELSVERAVFSLMGGPFALEGARLRLELPEADPAAAPLRLDGRSSLTGRVGGDTDGWRTVSGKLQLDVTGGRLPRSDILRAVSDAMLSRLPFVPESEESEDPEADEGLPLEEASATFAIAEGVARSEDLRAVTPDYVLEGSCEVAPDLTFELTGILQLTPSGFETVLSFAGLGLGLGDVGRVPPIPVRGEGPLTQARFQADASGLHLAAWALVPRSLGAVGGAVGQGVESLTDAARGAGDLLVPSRDGRDTEP